MRQSFWPDRARRSLLGPAWPWISPTDGASFSQRVRAALEPYWQKRLARLPEDYLSAQAREHVVEAAPRMRPDSVTGCGFDKVAAAAAGVPDAFWFFDLGSAAWVVTLGAMRAEGWIGDDEKLSLDVVEAAWRQHGAAKAIEEIDPALADRPAARPLLQLYRAPLAFWHEQDPAAAARALDRAVSRLSAPILGALGSTLPLTYAALHALQGKVEEAATFLEESHVEGRPIGMRGLDTPEVRYHRARYLWDLRRYDEARQLVRRVIEADPAYLIRLSTDPAWSELHGGQVASLHQMAGEVIGAARARIARFQQSRQEVDRANPAVRSIDETLQFVGDEPYMVLAAASLLPRVQEWRDQQDDVDMAFEKDLERLEEFADEIPNSFRLRLGGDYAPRFVGEGSDIARLRQMVEQERYRDANDFMKRIYEDLPWGVRLGTLSHLARLTQALATSGDVLRMRGREEDLPRLEKIVELLGRCVQLAEPARNMPETVGAELLRSMQNVWKEIEAIETAWIESEKRQFGRMRIVVPDEVKPVRRGGWISIQVRVTDVAGNPVAGVPVLWRVASGPALPKEPADCLEGEWDLSLHTGTVHITVEARGRGDGGVIEAHILGGYSPVRLEYRVVDA